jgi:hypothetical protein
MKTWFEIFMIWSQIPVPKLCKICGSLTIISNRECCRSLSWWHGSSNQQVLVSPVPLCGSGPDSANSNRVTLACLKLRLLSMFMSPCYALGMTQTWFGALISTFLSSAEMNWSTISIIAWIETEWHQLMSLFLYEMWFSQQAWTPHLFTSTSRALRDQGLVQADQKLDGMPSNWVEGEPKEGGTSHKALAKTNAKSVVAWSVTSYSYWLSFKILLPFM